MITYKYFCTYTRGTPILKYSYTCKYISDINTKIFASSTYK